MWLDLFESFHLNQGINHYNNFLSKKSLLIFLPKRVSTLTYQGLSKLAKFFQKDKIDLFEAQLMRILIGDNHTKFNISLKVLDVKWIDVKRYYRENPVSSYN